MALYRMLSGRNANIPDQIVQIPEEEGRARGEMRWMKSTAFLVGYFVTPAEGELEQRTLFPETDVTGRDLLMTGMPPLAYLNDFSDDW